MDLVDRGLLAQAVVDVQRADMAGAEERDRDVEQACRVPAAGEHRHERPAACELPSGPDDVANLLDGHGLLF